MSGTTEASEVKRRARHVFVVLPATALATGIAATQFIAWRLNNDPILGAPIAGHIYWPWRVVQWWMASWEPAYAGTFALLRLGLVTVGCLGLLAIAKGTRKHPAKHSDIHGTARFAIEAEIRDGGLLPRRATATQAGIIVGGWTHRNGALSYLTHTNKAHVLCMGPTRSGKSFGCMLPTLLTWPDSTIVYDPKGELYQHSAGWRQEEAGNTVLRLAPAELENTVAWNPLDRVRTGTPYAYRDVANIITQIADPGGQGLSDHWEPSAANFLIGITLLLLGLHGRSSLNAGLSAIDSAHDPETLLKVMAACALPQVAEVGRGMLATASRERASIISTARRQLMIFRDPVIARNTMTSDFSIDDLMNADRPMTLYLEARGEDELRLRPLVRLFLTLAIGQLISAPSVVVDGKQQSPHRHPLLLAIDEFAASLGKMKQMEVFLSKSAGAGITALLLAQDYQQILDAYGPNENITGHCQVIAAYPPNNDKTAEWLSRKTGQSTVVVEDISESQNSGKRSQNRTFRSVPRVLLTPDEVTRLKAPERDAAGLITTPGELLIFQAGQHVIRATQSLAFRDPEFVRRMEIPPPTIGSLNAPATGPHGIRRPRRWQL